MLRVDYARWGQTPEDLRHLALSAPHARTRERALALFDITQHSCATQVAVRTGRRPHTVIGWVHAYNAQGPDALAFRRTGGRRPFFARSAKPTSARSSAPPSAQPRRRPEPGPIPRRAGRCAAWSAGCAPGSGWWSAARRSARPCTASSCRGRKPRSFSAEPTRSGGRPLLSSSRACWPAPNATSTSWSTWTRRTSTRTRTSAMAGVSTAEQFWRMRRSKIPSRDWRGPGERTLFSLGVGGGRGSSLAPVFTCPEPIALAIHLQNVHVVRETVEQRSRQALRAKHARPLVKRQIARHEH